MEPPTSCRRHAACAAHRLPTGVAQDNSQTVLRISNRVTLQQAWFNEARTRKPLTWAAGDADAAALDPTGGGGDACDFCCWQTLTAEDTWGR